MIHLSISNNILQSAEVDAHQIEVNISEARLQLLSRMSTAPETPLHVKRLFVLWLAQTIYDSLKV